MAKRQHPAEFTAGNASGLRREAIAAYEPVMWVMVGNTVVASFAEDRGEDIAGLVALLGEGAVVCRKGGRLLWVEGHEEQSAGESYDFTAQAIYDRT